MPSAVSTGDPIPQPLPQVTVESCVDGDRKGILLHAGKQADVTSEHCGVVDRSPTLGEANVPQQRPQLLSQSPLPLHLVPAHEQSKIEIPAMNQPTLIILRDQTRTRPLNLVGNVVHENIRHRQPSRLGDSHDLTAVLCWHGLHQLFDLLLEQQFNDSKQVLGDLANNRLESINQLLDLLLERSHNRRPPLLRRQIQIHLYPSLHMGRLVRHVGLVLGVGGGHAAGVRKSGCQTEEESSHGWRGRDGAKPKPGLRDLALNTL
mmetsp:Transcript_8057/g.19087  ORF Transcript_8057/g.19087 Transcript_8057/m.19087 type:complete len:262 (+) Transcript_8057:645-1430(+)